MRNITITGSEGLIGKELCKFFQKNNHILKLDLQLGHDLSNEKFVKKWFKDNPTDHLINCFALNDHVDNNRKKNTLYNFSLDTFNKYLEINLVSLFSVCREFARNNKTGTMGHIGSWSFESTKHVTSNEGGIVTTNDENLALIMRQFGGVGFKNITAKTGKIRISRDKFQDPNWERHNVFAYNYRLSELCAAVALAQCERLEEFVMLRIKMGKKYFDVLKKEFLKNMEIKKDAIITVKNSSKRLLNKAIAKIKNDIISVEVIIERGEKIIG
jgi:hypothetical protein